MEILIDIEDSTPIFTQLVTQIKNAVMAGEIVPGDSLPSIRQLANDLDINNKTVAKAYGLLERDSVIQKKGYRGTFVHPDALENCSFDLNEWLLIKFNELITLFRKSGATDSEIRISFGNSMNKNSNIEGK